MNKKNLFVRISLIFVLLLLVAAVLVGCGGDVAETHDTTTGVSEAAEYAFTFTAVFADGTKEEHSIVTSFETVGEVLIAEGLIEGEDGAYGMYVKKVCGVTADYDVDGTYWALYVDGEYGMTGVESLKCSDVKNVEFRVEK